jgi:hypothetical protein
MSQTDSQKSPSVSHVKKHTGGCLCGAVRFEAELDLSGKVSRCNCTLCTKIGASGIIVKPSAFRLLSGTDSVSEFRVNANSPNYRVFCKRCGIHCYGAGYVEELGGAFCSINVNCLDDIDPSELTFQYWDGRHDNWMAGARSEPWPVRTREAAGTVAVEGAAARKEAGASA